MCSIIAPFGRPKSWIKFLAYIDRMDSQASKKVFSLPEISEPPKRRKIEVSPIADSSKRSDVPQEEISENPTTSTPPENPSQQPQAEKSSSCPPGIDFASKHSFRVRSVQEDSEFVSTPVLVENGKIVPPSNRDKDHKYGVKWHLQAPLEHLDDEEYNSSLSSLKDFEKMAWLVKGINHVKLAVFEGEVLELLFFNWESCWVPLNLVLLDSRKLKLEKEQQEDRWENSSQDAKDRLRKEIPSHFEKIMALVRLTNRTKLRVTQITKYACLVDEEGFYVDAVKVQFKQTYEHCTALLGRTLYRNLYLRRIEAAQAYLKRTTCTIMERFLSKAREELAKLE